MIPAGAVCDALVPGERYAMATLATIPSRARIAMSTTSIAGIEPKRSVSRTSWLDIDAAPFPAARWGDLDGRSFLSSVAPRDPTLLPTDVPIAGPPNAGAASGRMTMPAAAWNNREQQSGTRY